MITEDYVSFETAKLLKKKRFNEPCHGCYITNKEIGYYDYYSTNFELRDDIISAPTLQMAMKWLRNEHDLFIRITEDITGSLFEWSIYQKNYGRRMSMCVENSYEQACEVAIKYCLKNLI